MFGGFVVQLSFFADTHFGTDLMAPGDTVAYRATGVADCRPSGPAKTPQFSHTQELSCDERNSKQDVGTDRRSHLPRL